MPEPTHRKLRLEPGSKSVSPEAYARGQALYQLILRLGYEPVSFSAESGIHLSTLWMYINGSLDIVKMKQSNVEKLLGSLGVTDTWAWAYFTIPLEARKTWRTFRPPPLGHGEDPRDLYELSLDRATTGRYVLWPLDVITLDRSNRELGVLLARVGDQLIINERSTLPNDAEIIGQVVRMEPAFPVHGQSRPVL